MGLEIYFNLRSDITFSIFDQRKRMPTHTHCPSTKWSLRHLGQFSEFRFCLLNTNIKNRSLSIWGGGGVVEVCYLVSRYGGSSFAFAAVKPISDMKASNERSATSPASSADWPLGGQLHDRLVHRLQADDATENRIVRVNESASAPLVAAKMRGSLGLATNQHTVRV